MEGLFDGRKFQNNIRDEKLFGMITVYANLTSTITLKSLLLPNTIRFSHLFPFAPSTSPLPFTTPNESYLKGLDGLSVPCEQCYL